MTVPAPAATSDLTAATLAFLRRYGRTVAVLTLLTPVVAVAASYFVRPLYRSWATFVPETPPRGANLPASLSGAAELLGVSLGSPEARPPQFYVEVLTGRGSLRQLLTHPFEGPDGTTTLLEEVDAGGDTPAEQMERAELKLRKRVDASSDTRNTGIITVSVEAPHPDLAAEATNTLIQNLNAFLLQNRRRDARQRREFLQERVQEARAELEGREGALLRFYQRNRSWEGSPELRYDEAALRRQVELTQAVYLSLVRDYESARIEEANTTPALSVIDSAVAPTRKSRPQRTRIGFLALVLGAAAGVALGLLVDLLARTPEAELPGGLRRLRRLVDSRS